MSNQTSEGPFFLAHRMGDFGIHKNTAPKTAEEKSAFLADFQGEFTKQFGAELDPSCLPLHTRLVLNPESLVWFCKHNGDTLYATKHGFVTETNFQFQSGNSRFVLLSRTVASKSQDAVDGLDRTIYGGYFVPQSILQDLNNRLTDDTSEIRKISSWPIDRTFLYMDVSDFSNEPPGKESLIINSIVAMIGSWEVWNYGIALSIRESVEAKICIGDGYIFVFRDPMNAVYFGAWLASLTEEMVARNKLPVDFHFRMGVHTGKVYSFWDPGREGWNYIGDGINGGNRVLAAVGKETDDVMFISGQVRAALMATGKDEHPYGKIRASLQNRGRKADKHGKLWRVFEVNQSQLCGQDVLAVVNHLG
jgi:hypothetical protein